MIAYYSDANDLPPKTVTVSGLSGGEALWLLDEENDMARRELCVKDGAAVITLEPYSVILIRR